MAGRCRSAFIRWFPGQQRWRPLERLQSGPTRCKTNCALCTMIGSLSGSLKFGFRLAGHRWPQRHRRTQPFSRPHGGRGTAAGCCTDGRQQAVGSVVRQPRVNRIGTTQWSESYLHLPGLRDFIGQAAAHRGGHEHWRRRISNATAASPVWRPGVTPAGYADRSDPATGAGQEAREPPGARAPVPRGNCAGSLQRHVSAPRPRAGGARVHLLDLPRHDRGPRRADGPDLAGPA